MKNPKRTKHGTISGISNRVTQSGRYRKREINFRRLHVLNDEITKLLLIVKRPIHNHFVYKMFFFHTCEKEMHAVTSTTTLLPVHEANKLTIEYNAVTPTSKLKSETACQAYSCNNNKVYKIYF